MSLIDCNHMLYNDKLIYIYTNIKKNKCRALSIYTAAPYIWVKSRSKHSAVNLTNHLIRRPILWPSQSEHHQIMSLCA